MKPLNASDSQPRKLSGSTLDSNSQLDAKTALRL